MISLAGCRVSVVLGRLLESLAALSVKAGLVRRAELRPRTLRVKKATNTHSRDSSRRDAAPRCTLTAILAPSCVLLDGAGKPLGPQQGTMLGRLFESLVTLSVRVLAQRAEASVAHLRTRNGDHEVDLMLIDPEGRVLAIEVKLSGTISDHDVRHLKWLAGRHGDQLIDSVVITTGSIAYRRPDGIAVVPLALLGP